jgi:ubiquinone/menaquinone biosynthesis C-methylase UbiE
MKKIIPILLIAGASCNQPTSDEKNEVSKKDSTSSTEKHKHHHGHGHGNANEYMHEKSFEELVANFESQDRIDYQQPDKVLEYLGNLKGKKIMDIGAGTGFFSFRLVEKGAIVIAADVSEDFQNYIAKKKDSLKIGEDKLSLRKLGYDSPSLSDEEVDMVIIVNTYHHIENRKDYFALVKKGLKKGGRLVVIDFKKHELPVGPPVEMKLTADEVSEELKSSGFSSTEINKDLLEYQYIVIAKK